MKDLQNETEFESGEVEHARAERFVDSILPHDRVLKVLDIRAGEQRFDIRRPIYVAGVDVLKAERGRRPDAGKHRVFVIGLPNVVSLKGFLVRLTPWSVHRWFYARVPRAEPGDHPAPSVHSLSLRPSSLLTGIIAILTKIP